MTQPLDTSASSTTTTQEDAAFELALLRSAAVGIVLIRSRRVQCCNPQFAITFGYDSPTQMQGLHVSRMYRSNAEFTALGTAAESVLAQGAVFHAERQLCRNNGEVFWARLSGRLLNAKHPEQGAVWVVDEIDGQRSPRGRTAATRTARISDVEGSTGPVRGVACFVHGRLTYCDPALERLLGYKPGALITRAQSEQDAQNFLSNTPLGVLHEHSRHEDGNGNFEGTVSLRHRNGRLVECRAVCRPLDAFEPQLGQIWVLLDAPADASAHTGSVTLPTPREGHLPQNAQVVAASELAHNERRVHEHIHQLAYYDSLTGLPNRALLNERSSQAIAVAQATGAPIAVIFVNLDRFKHVNDSLGHRVGDALLTQAAQRFQAIVREKDTVSRLGGDEFILLLPGADDEGAKLVARKLQEVSTQPYRIEGHELGLTPSIGIALYPRDGRNIEELTQAADMAMHQAKVEGRNTVRVFNTQMRSKSQRALVLENAMRRALENNEFSLHYQPQVSIATGEIFCVEALLRWNSPSLGFVSPGEFIPIAEESGLILQIGEWVLRTAVRQLRAWLDRGRDDLRIAVNISALQFHQTRLPEIVSQVLQDAGVPPHLLELELTEGVAVHDPEVVSGIIDELNHRGVLLAMDDFGTGYSSLSQLRRFHIHKLKIDQSFIRTIDTNESDKKIVSAIIQMAQALDMHTTAEGVETQAQVDLLRELGCRKVQGYFYSRPLPAEQLEAFLDKHQAWACSLPDSPT